MLLNFSTSYLCCLSCSAKRVGMIDLEWMVPVGCDFSGFFVEFLGYAVELVCFYFIPWTIFVCQMDSHRRSIVRCLHF